MKSALHISTGLLYLVTTLANSLLWAAPAHANPQGGQVVAGDASISSNGAKLDVIQNTDRAVIDWNDFSIGAGEHTQFHQPSADATVLNRVTGNNLSDISGTLSANGNVILVNRNGIMFRDGASVDVGSLVATTADTTNDRFMAGDMRFDIAGKPDARITNAGSITAREAGLVGLVAPQVENSGVIRAKLGKVQLASGDTFSLDLSGRNLVGIAVSDAVSSQLVSHSGRIEAEGGHVAITAAAGRELVDSLIRIEGEIHAPTVAARSGVIHIGDEAVVPRVSAAAMPRAITRKVLVNAVVEASGDTTGEQGGRITIAGDDITLESLALLRATGYDVTIAGQTVGGDIRIGGDYQGAQSDIANARFVDVKQGARIDASATQSGDGGRIIVWSDGATTFKGQAKSTGGADVGDGGFVEISGKRLLEMAGEVDTTAANGETGELLLDPGDITVCSFGTSSVAACNPTGSPSLVAAANIFDSGANATSYVNIGATGTAGTLLNLLNSANVTIRTNAGGAGNGDITIADAVSWTATRLLTLDAHRDIVVNANMTGNQMTFNPGRDLVLNANLIDSGTSTLTITPRAGGATSFSVGSGTGTLNITDAEWARINTGWNTLNIGNASYTGSLELDSFTSVNPLTITTTGGALSTLGTVAMGANALTITSGTASIGGAITGTGALVLQPSSNATVGIGTGATGAYNLDDTELNFLGTTFSGVTLGNATSTGAVDVRARTWQDPLTIRTGNAGITINGAQTMGANALTLSSRTIAIAAGITGTGALTLQPDATATVGIGTGATGTYNLDDTELNFLGTTFSGITIGNTASDANMDVRARTWNDPLSLRVRNGTITINGAQTMGANALTLTSRLIAIAAGITGTGGLTLQPDTTSTVGVGTGATGAYNLDDTELNFLGTTFSGITIGNAASDANMDVRARTWSDPVTMQVRNGTITINGNQTMGANALTLTSRDIVINNAITGTGALTLQPDGNVAVGIGTGATGTYLLSTAELDLLGSTFSSLNIGRTNSTQAMDIRAYSNWRDNTNFFTGTGTITVNGAQNFNGNSAGFAGRGIVFANTVSNGNILTLQPEGNVSFGVGTGAAGTSNISNATLDNIQGTWNGLVFGNTAALDSLLTVANRTWNYNTTFAVDDNNISLAGATMAAGRNLTLQSDRDILFTGAVNGTSTSVLTFNSATTGNAITLGAASATTEVPIGTLGNIAAGWGRIDVGATNNTGGLTINANSWNAPTRFLSGTGATTIAGAQTMGANNLTIEIAGTLALNAALTGTQDLLIRGATTAATIVLGATGGTFDLDATELGRITDGWSNVQFGRTDATGTITLNAATWNDPTRFMTNSGIITVSGAQNFNGNAATFETNANLAINANLAGTGVLSVRQAATNVAMGIAGGAGVLIDATELTRIASTFSDVVFGRTDSTAAFTVGAATWSSPATLLNGASGITFTGAQNMGANRLLAQTASGGNITLNAGATISSTAAGNAITLAPAGHLINNAGASALSVTGGGRWLTYSSTLAGETTGGLVGDFRRFTCAFGGACPTLGTGNGQMYGNTPVLTITPNHTITYGDAFTTYNYTTAGYLNAADSAGDVLTGTLTGSSTYVTGNDAGSYNITYASGTLTSAYGYGLSYANNATGLTVGQKALTATVQNAATIAYGDTVQAINPVTGVVWTGFIGGQDASVIDSITFDYDTLTAGLGAGDVGTFALGIAAFSDTNYSLNIAGDVTDGSLTVTKRAVTATVNSPTPITQGSLVPAATATWSNLAFGQTPAVFDSVTYSYGGATQGAASILGDFILSITAFSDNHYTLSLPAGVTNGLLRVIAAPVIAEDTQASTDDILPNTVRLVSQGADGMAMAQDTSEQPLDVHADTGNLDDGQAMLAGLIRIHPQLRILLNRSAAEDF